VALRTSRTQEHRLHDPVGKAVFVHGVLEPSRPLQGRRGQRSWYTNHANKLAGSLC
jgi:hypothetical protein